MITGLLKLIINSFKWYKCNRKNNIMHNKFYKRLFLMMNGFLYQQKTRICGLLLMSTQLLAQIDNKSLENENGFYDTKLKKVQFHFAALSYVKNNEYFNEIADGYTLFGYYLNPTVSYQPHQKVQIEAGVFVRKVFGNSGFKETEPTFTVQIKQANWRFLFGNIEGNISHRMIEPLLSFERLLSQPLEHGIQAKYQYKEAFFDAWIDWQRSTLPGQSNQEYIWNGLSFYAKPLRFDASALKGLTFQPIVQTSVFHEGGQNIQSVLPVRTLLNLTAGLRVQKALNNGQTLTFDNYYVAYFESPRRGTAYYFNTFWKNPKYQIGLSYWLGHYFTSPFGGDLFQSISKKFGANYYEEYRNLLVMRMSREWNISKGIDVLLRIEPHYDFQNRIFEHSEGVYLKCSL